jgi:hypothetical protein
LGTGEDGFICSADGRLNRGPKRLVLRSAREQSHYLVYSQGTRDLSRGGTAHSITNEIHAVLDGVTESVFVGRAFAASI